MGLRVMGASGLQHKAIGLCLVQHRWAVSGAPLLMPLLDMRLSRVRQHAEAVGMF